MKKIIKYLIVVLVLSCLYLFIGCRNTPVSNRPIQIVSRETGSGTRDGFMEHVTGNKSTILPIDAIIVDNTASMISNIRSNPGAIGYDSFGYVTDDVKILDLDGISPLNDGYPLERALTVVYKTKLDVKDPFYNNYAAGKFLEYITSSDVVDRIELGYLITKGGNTEKYVVESGLSGLVKISGSTSLEPLMQQLKAMYQLVQPDVRIDITAGGSGVGRDDVRDDKVDFGMISAALTEDQINDISKGDNTIVVNHDDIAIDRIAIIVNKKNPYTTITTQQLSNIFDKSKQGYNKWSDMYN